MGRKELETEAPKARLADLLIEDLGEELVLFDTRRNEAHALDAGASAVWRACDGRRSPAQIAEHCGLDETVVELTLPRLAACDLLANAVSRRTMLRRVALTGAVVGLPLVTSIAVPNAAAAASLNLGGLGGLGGGGTSGQGGGSTTTTSSTTTTTWHTVEPGPRRWQDRGRHVDRRYVDRRGRFRRH